METYLAQRPSRSYLSWENVLVDLLERLDQAELVRLAELIREQDHPARSLNQIAKRLLSLDASEEAWKIGESALAATEASGWIRRLTGGVRVETFSVLYQIDPVRASELAFQMLLEDLRTGRIGFASFGFELHEIAPLLGSTLVFQRIWESLEPYVQALFPLANGVEPPRLDNIDAETSEAAAVLTALVVDLVDHPVFDIKHGAQRVVFDLLREGEPTIVAPVASALSALDRPKQRLLVCLQAIAEENPEANRPFLTEFQGLASSLHFGERVAAYRLLGSLGMAPPLELKSRELPSVYGLAFPEREEPYFLRPVEAHKPLPPTEDPVAIAKIINGELGVISDLTAIQSAALYNRAAQLVREPIGPEKERKLRKQTGKRGARVAFPETPDGSHLSRPLLDRG